MPLFLNTKLVLVWGVCLQCALCIYEESREGLDDASMLQKKLVHSAVQASAAEDKTRPGAKLWLSQASMNYLSQKMLPLLLDSLMKIEIPAIEGQTSAGPLTFNYKINNFNIASVGVSSPNILLSPTGLQLAFHGMTVHASADYDVQADNYFQVPYSSGSVTLEVGEGTALSARAILGVNNGRPTISISQVLAKCEGSANVGGSSLSAIINAVTSVFNGRIMSMLQDLIEENFAQFATSTLNCLILQNLNTVFPIPLPPPLDKAAIDLSFLQLSTNSKFATAAVRGSFVSTIGGVETPLCEGLLCKSPVNIGDAPADSFANVMLGAALSDYTVESALKIFQAQGVLNITLRQKDMPSDVPVKLTTYGFSKLLIGGFKLPSMCDAPRVSYGLKPGNCNISLDVSVMDDISASMDDGYVSGNLPILFEFYVDSHKTPGKRTFIFSFSSQSSAKGAITIKEGNTLLARAKSVSLRMKLVKSALLLNPPVSLFNPLIDFVLNTVAVPMVNIKLATGFPLLFNMSLFNVSATNAQVNIENELGTVTSDMAVQVDFTNIVQRAVTSALTGDDDAPGCMR